MADEILIETTTDEILIETTTTEVIEVGLVGPQGPIGGTGTVYSTDLEITDAEKGLVLRDSNGTRYRITLDTFGVLTVTAL